MRAHGNIALVQDLRELSRSACILKTSRLGIHANILVELMSFIYAQASQPARLNNPVGRPETKQTDDSIPSNLNKTRRVRDGNVGCGRPRGRPRGSRARRSKARGSEAARDNNQPVVPWDQSPEDWSLLPNVTASQSQASELRLEGSKRDQAALPQRESIDGPKKRRT